jgi:hypothetical protein
VIGVTSSGVFMPAYVLAMEMVGPKHRVTAGALCSNYFTVGMFLMAGIGTVYTAGGIVNERFFLLTVSYFLTR